MRKRFALFVPFLLVMIGTPPARAQSAPPDIRYSLSDVAERSLPSVVTILSTKTIRGRTSSRFNDFFFGPGQDGFRQQGLGSGVIVSENGLILTNNHVIDGADELKVRLHNGAELNATLVGTDPRTDVAVIRVNKKGLRAAPLGNSDRLRIAEQVLCVGSPLSENLGHTVTQGIVSAMGRSGVGITDYEDFIQTDAAINPGNSGGPMLNLAGEVVGINTAIASRTGGFQGVGFAVPSNMAKRVMEQLVETGRVSRGWMGVVIQPVTEELAEALELSTSEGVLITELVPDGPAAKGGLEAGDLVIAIDNKPMRSVPELRNHVAQTPPGQSLELTVFRGQRNLKRTVAVGEFPDDPRRVSAARPGEAVQERGGLIRLGIRVEKLTRARKEELGVPGTFKGLEITEVEEGSKAFEGGLRPGDVLVEFNRKAISDPDTLNQRLEKLERGSTVLLKVRRGAGSLFLAMRL